MKMMRWEFAGNTKTLAALENFFSSGRFPHALLLCGEDGTGKGALATRIAMALCCSAPGTDRPCGICSHCRKITHNIHPDLSVYGEAKGTRSFHVDQIRALIGDLHIRPNEAACRVFLLKNCENLTAAAANALLKALEEPPAATYFILTAPSKEKLLPTILSRVTVFTLQPPDVEEAVPLIMQAAGCDEITATQAAGQFGNIGRSVAFLTDQSLQKKYQQIQQILSALTSPYAAPLSLALLPFEKQDRTETVAFLGLLGEELGRLMRRQIDDVSRGIPGLQPTDLAALRQIVSDTADRLRRNAATAPALSLMAARMRSL